MPALFLSTHPPLHSLNSIFTTYPHTTKTSRTRTLCTSSLHHIQPQQQLKTLTTFKQPIQSSQTSISLLIVTYGIESTDKVPILETSEETEIKKNGEFQEFVDKIRVLSRKEIDELVKKVLIFGDVVEFNDMLMALVVANEHQLAVKLFSNLICDHENVADSGTWSIMIRCYAKMNEPDVAQRLLSEMLELGYKPSVGTFTVLINSFCRRGKLSKAFNVLDVMRGIGVKPSVQTYNCIIKGLCYVGKVESAYELLVKIKESSEKPDIYSYTAVMDGFCKVGRSDEAMEFLNEAISIGLKPSVVTYNTLLNGYVKEGKPMEGVKLLNQMQEKNYQPDYISYITLLHGLLKWGKVHESLKLCKEMLSRGFEVDERMMNTLLTSLCRLSWKEEDLIKEVYDVFDIMRKGSYSIYPCAYNVVVQTMCIDERVDMALVCLNEMLRCEVVVRMTVFNCVIRGLCGEGRVEEGMNVLSMIYGSGRVPSVICYNLVIDCLNKERRWFEACSVYGVALKVGIVTHKKPRRSQPVKRYLFY